MTRSVPTSFLALCLLLGASAPAVAADTDAREVARRALSGELTAAETKRLLGKRAVRAALEELLDGWDGTADELIVTRDDEHLRLRALIREQQTRCFTPPASAERPDPEPVCYEELEVTAERSLTLDVALLRPRPRPKPAPDPPPEAEPTPAPAPAPEPGPSILHPPPKLDPLDLHIERMSPELARLHAGHVTFRDRVSTTYWTDPFRPAGLDTPAELMAEANPPPKTVVLPSSNSEAQLANPFSDGRLGGKLDLPQHPMHTVRYDAHPVETAVIDTPDFACLRAWAAGAASKQPPELACFVAALSTARLDRSPHEVASWLATLLPSPLSVIASEVARDAYESARDQTAGELVWGATWLAWVDTRRLRLGDAVRALTDAERRTLRRRLYRWWSADPYAAHHDAIGTIYEEHLLDLYPSLAGPDGLPQRRLFRDDFLWGTNWIARQGTADEVVVRARFDALTGPERDILRALATDRRLRRRFSRVAAVIDGPG